jgi:hypothetical protein
VAGFARAAGEVLLAEVMGLVDDLLDGRPRRGRRRSPFYAVPFLRTNFLPGLGAAALAGLAIAWLRRR